MWADLHLGNSWEVLQPMPRLKCTFVCWIIDSQGNTQLVTCYARAAGKCHPSSERDIKYFTLPAAHNKAAWGVSITSSSDLPRKGETPYKTHTLECKIFVYTKRLAVPSFAEWIKVGFSRKRKCYFQKQKLSTSDTSATIYGVRLANERHATPGSPK